MTQTDTPTKPVRPDDAEVALVEVVQTTRISEGFIRITVTGHDDVLARTFTPMGHDQWVRLFLPHPDQVRPVIARGGMEGWYLRWLELDEDTRSTIRNYTIRASRQRPDGNWELDLDFVVHAGPSGEVDGAGASWALAARPGDLLGLLDQGTIFDIGGIDPTGTVVMLADETGIPAAEGIAASLADDQQALLLLEVAHEHDRRDLPTRADLEVRWIDRGTRPSGSALAEAITTVDLSPADYVYIVGEAGAVLHLRAEAQRRGALKSRVDFCAYWRPERRAG